MRRVISTVVTGKPPFLAVSLSTVRQNLRARQSRNRHHQDVGRNFLAKLLQVKVTICQLPTFFRNQNEARRFQPRKRID
jgi:hypothetical protein